MVAHSIKQKIVQFSKKTSNFFCKLYKVQEISLAILILLMVLSFLAIVIFLTGWTVVKVLLGILALLGILITCLNHFFQKRGKNLFFEMTKISAKGNKFLAAQDELLRQKMISAISRIKSSDLAGNQSGFAALYLLPWFAVIGPPSNGKSTLLRNSGLNFPFSENKKYQLMGVGGTRNCDWWFSDQAIFLDTAGRYTVANKEKDSSEWINFLKILKRYRAKQPLNGIIITLGITDIIFLDREEKAKLICQLQTRTKELYNQLGLIIPVYFVFTKTDRIQGFNTFFSKMTDQEKQQIWGVDLSDLVMKDNLEQLYLNKFEELCHQIVRATFSKISIEHDNEKKREIFDFPYQFRAVAKVVCDFLLAFSKKNPYEEPKRIIGAYFTSSVQEQGNRVGLRKQIYNGDGLQDFECYHGDPLIQDDENKSQETFFVKDLLERLLTSDTIIASKNKREIKRTQIKLTFSGFVVFLSLSLLLYALFNAIRLNKEIYIDGEVVAMKNTQATTKKLYMNSKAMDFRRELISFYYRLDGYKDSVPFYLRLGLYQGSNMIGPITSLLNHNWYNKILLPIKSMIEKKLHNFSKHWRSASNQEKMVLRGNYYSLFKAYMMLCFPKQLEPDFMARVVGVNLADKFKSTPSIINHVNKNYNLVKYYMSLYKDTASKVSPDFNIISLARSDLRTPTNASNLYAQIRTQALEEYGKLNLEELINNPEHEIVISKMQISKFYSINTWKSFVQPKIDALVHSASINDWVMDIEPYRLNSSFTYQKVDSELSNKYKAQLLQLYFSEYAQAWLRFLSSISVREFTSIQQGAWQFHVLTAKSGPYQNLFKKAHYELSVFRDIDLRYLTNDTKMLIKILNGFTAADAELSRKFYKKMNTVQQQLDRLINSPHPGRDSLLLSQRILSYDKNDKVEIVKAYRDISQALAYIDSAYIRRNLKQLLSSPFQQAWRVIILEAKRELNERWIEEVYQVYKKYILTKFPFSNSTEEVSELDIVEFFNKSDGILWTFFDDSLSNLIDLRGGAFHEKKWLNQGFDFSRQFLYALLFSKKISSGLLKDKNIGFNFEVYPIPNHKIKELLFESGQRYIKYQNGPQEWTKISWPGKEENDGAMLRIIPTKIPTPLSVEYFNRWGLLHLLKEARLQLINTNKFKAVWHLKDKRGEDYQVAMIIRGRGRDSILNTLLFDYIPLPKKIINE